jgi:hypothetical protein
VCYRYSRAPTPTECDHHAADERLSFEFADKHTYIHPEPFADSVLGDSMGSHAKNWRLIAYNSDSIGPVTAIGDEPREVPERASQAVENRRFPR